MTSTIRYATPEDAGQIQAIYAPVVENTVISFELEAPDLAEMRQRIVKYGEIMPWLVWEAAGEVLGYAYGSRHRERAAYRWATDVSVYVRDGARRSGVARSLYSTLFRMLAALGYYNAYAGIALPNEASVRLHTSLGFEPVGVYRQVGYKLGGWHDVGWWQLRLQPLKALPEPPVLLKTALENPELQQKLAACLDYDML